MPTIQNKLERLIICGREGDIDGLRDEVNDLLLHIPAEIQGTTDPRYVRSLCLDLLMVYEIKELSRP